MAMRGLTATPPVLLLILLLSCTCLGAAAATARDEHTTVHTPEIDRNMTQDEMPSLTPTPKMTRDGHQLEQYAPQPRGAHTTVVQAQAVGSVGSRTITVQVDGTPRVLEVLEGRPAHESALPFCRTHNLLPHDCNKLIEHLQRHDQPLATTPPQHTAPPVHHHHQDGNPPLPEGATKASSENEVTSMDPGDYADDVMGSEGASMGVDYSRKVGAPLRVTMQDRGGEAVNLQRYHGETVPEAVHRFCAQHVIVQSQCTVVEAKFRELNDWWDERMQHLSNPMSVKGGGGGRHDGYSTDAEQHANEGGKGAPGSEEAAAAAAKTRTWFIDASKAEREASFFSKAQWKFVVLAFTLLVVFVQHQQHQQHQRQQQ